MDQKKNTQDEKADKWKSRLNDLLDSAQVEIKRTAELGKKMISASKTNSSLSDCYAKLGKLIYKDYKSNLIQLDSTRAKTIIESIDSLTNKLHEYEEDVQEIKKKEYTKEDRP